MVQTKKGGKTYRQTMIAKFGSEQAWREHMAKIGAKGGSNGNTGGFAADRNLARRAGAIGGKASKRRKTIDIR